MPAALFLYFCRMKNPFTMRACFIFLLFVPVVLSCNTATNQSNANNIAAPKVISTPEDEEILNKFINLFYERKDAPVQDLIVNAGIFLLNSSYAEHTLEHEPEMPVINLREMDCTTFIENSIALARTLKSEKQNIEQFAHELTNIRYRNGIVDDYTSRLHYFSDWIYENIKNERLKDISEDVSNTPLTLKLDFMSTHPESYKQLRDTALLNVIAAQEKEISARKMFYIPKNNLVNVEDKLNSGDVIAVTTNINGLDVSHTALLIRLNDRIHILHASSVAGKVVISDETLEDYLNNNNRSTGIIVARPR